MGKKLLSVEFYSTRDADLDFYEAINPSFCSLTWTARNLSDLDGLPAIALGKKLQQKSINMIMHVAGRNFKREEALTVINKIKDMGVRNILALKGGSNILEPDDSKCEFPYALQFLQFLRTSYGDYFNIATSGYPIGHPESADTIADIGYLKKKVQIGADFVMCQGVFDMKTFKDFYKRCRQQDIKVPIIPGVYAINSYEVLKNLMSFCKIIPPEYLNSMEKYQNNTDLINEYSINHVSNLIRSLLKDEEISIPGVHVFCFNNFTLVDLGPVA